MRHRRISRHSRTSLSDTKSQLKRSIQSIENEEEREISQAMMILIAAVGVGPNIDRLVDETAYPREVVEPIVTRMREAGLWNDEYIDNREWWNESGELNGEALFGHALVAVGKAVRETTLTGAKYLDAKTGEWMADWHCPDQIH